jgi:hypothetical protein
MDIGVQTKAGRETCRSRELMAQRPSDARISAGTPRHSFIIFDPSRTEIMFSRGMVLVCIGSK